MIIESDVKDYVDKILEKVDLDEIASMSIEEVAKKAIELGIYNNERSVKIFMIVQAITCIYNEEYAYPITVLASDEDIKEEDKYINSYGLTDDIVSSML